MEIVPIKIDAGEAKAWQEVCSLSREDVCKRTLATYDAKAGAYVLRCFGIDFQVEPCEMQIACSDPRGRIRIYGPLPTKTTWAAALRQVYGALGVKPEFGAVPEKTRQAQRHIRSYCPVFPEQLIDGLRRYSQLSCQTVT